MPGQISDFAEVRPALYSHLRLSTQIERYSNLNIRLIALAEHPAAGKDTPLSAAISALNADDSQCGTGSTAMQNLPAEFGTFPGSGADRVKRAK
jgi:hypothetical protein